MKLLLSALLLVLSFSCSHQQQVAQTPTNPRFPASDADSQDLAKMTNSQLLGYAGKNILRVTIACPVATNTLVITGVAETLPIFSAFASIGTAVGTNFEYSGTSRDKTATNYVGGSASGVVVDLTKIGYALLFEDSNNLLDESFKNAKSSYPATKHLAQNFYGVDGDCSLAGRRLVDTLTVIQSRKLK
ncbi:MAG: hypothetical protein V4654_09760 [Bdellovibrionota bacterium]